MDIRTIALALASATIAFAMSSASADQSHSVAIVNTTRMAMVSLQLRQSGTSAWQPNALNNRPLGVQKQTAIDVPGGCVFDVISSFEDGHHRLTPNVDLCETHRFVVNDR